MDKQTSIPKPQNNKLDADVSVNVIRKHGYHLLLLPKYRAFEERWKQKEEKEQRLRDKVLQQRRIKLQEATERFQRAHLPASQHKQIGL